LLLIGCCSQEPTLVAMPGASNASSVITGLSTPDKPSGPDVFNRECAGSS